MPSHPVVLVLYVAGLAGVLWWGALAVHVGGTGALAFELLRRARAAPTGWVVPTPYLVLAALTAVFFSQFTATISTSSTTSTPIGASWSKRCSPSTGSGRPRRMPCILGTHRRRRFGSTSSTFSCRREGFAYFGQFVLLFAPLLVLWEAIAWRQALWSIAVLALCALVLTNFGLGITSLYVDHVLGVWFAGTVFSFVLERNGPWPRVLSFAAPVAVIAFKDAGLPFALAAATIMAALYAQRAWPASVPFARVGAIRRGVPRLHRSSVDLRPGLGLKSGLRGIRRRRAVGRRDRVELVGGASGADPTTAEIIGRFVDVFLNQQLSNDAVSRQFNAFSYDAQRSFQPVRLTTATLLLTVVAWWIVLGRFGSAAGRTLDPCHRSVRLLGHCGGLHRHVVLQLPFRLWRPWPRAVVLHIRYVHTVVLPLVLCSFAPLLPAFSEAGTSMRWVIAGRPLSRHATLFGAALVALYLRAPSPATADATERAHCTA